MIKWFILGAIASALSAITMSIANLYRLTTHRKSKAEENDKEEEMARQRGVNITMSTEPPPSPKDGFIPGAVASEVVWVQCGHRVNNVWRLVTDGKEWSWANIGTDRDGSLSVTSRLNDTAIMMRVKSSGGFSSVAEEFNLFLNATEQEHITYPDLPENMRTWLDALSDTDRKFYDEVFNLESSGVSVSSPKRRVKLD